MDGFMSVLSFLMMAIPFGITFLYGCTGEIITEKVGHLNLGIPGIMCMGGAGGCIVLQLLMTAGGVPPVLVVILGILGAFAMAALMGLFYSFLTVTLKANQNVTGLVMTIFGSGLTKFIIRFITTPASGGGPDHAYLDAVSYFRYPFSAIKSEDNMMIYWGVMVFLAIVIALVSSFVLFRTKVGLHLRAVGENPATADAVGINVTAYKYVATIIGSGIAGLGGLFYIMNCSGTVDAYKSIESFGWLAVALVIFTLWRPHLSILGSMIFGILSVVNTYIDGVSVSVTYVTQMLPYVVTIIVLIITSIRNKPENQPPAGLGSNYYREER